MRRPDAAAEVWFQPLMNIALGSVVATAARTPAVADWRDGADDRRNAEREVLAATASAGAAAEAAELVRPVHVRLSTATVAEHPDPGSVLLEPLERHGWGARDLTVEVSFAARSWDPDLVRLGVQQLRRRGFHIAVADVDTEAVPLGLLADLRPEVIKLDPHVLAQEVSSSATLLVLESFRQFARSAEAELVVCGVDTSSQLLSLRRAGVHLAQGDHISTALSSAALSQSHAAVLPEPHRPADDAGPRVAEFLRPAVTLPETVLAGQVQEAFAAHPNADSVVLIDDQHRPCWTLDRNRFLLAITGAYGYALHGNKPATRLADAPRLVTTSTTALDALELIRAESRNRRYDDAVVTDAGGCCLGVVQASDVVCGLAELKTEQAAALNPLTRLPGSDVVAEVIRHRIDRGEPLAVTWLDIDDFKQINDTAGFATGDEVIRGLGQLLTDAATTFETVHVAHLGGDDFVIACHPDELDPLAAKLLESPLPAPALSVTVSLATLTCPPDQAASFSTLSRALTPLKRTAKQLCGSSWVVSSFASEQVEIRCGHRSESTTSTEDVDWAGQLRTALEQDRLAVHFQPILDWHGTVISAEALVRWPHPTHGTLGPNAFLPLAEQVGLLADLDARVLHTAAREAASWAANTSGPTVSVNLTGLAPGTSQFVDTVKHILAESGLRADRLILELVETALTAPHHATRSDMDRLSELGVRFALDDFGTGYSTMARLKELPIHVLKIDRQLTTPLNTAADRMIVRTLADMAAGVNATCIAEGVETTHQLRTLHELGTDAYQGWLFAPALPNNEFRHFLGDTGQAGRNNTGPHSIGGTSSSTPHVRHRRGRSRSDGI